MTVAEPYATMIRELPPRMGCHSAAHIRRVVLLCAALAEAVGVTGEELDILLTAAAYHDAGRTDDGADTWHGAAGYEVYRRKHGDHRGVQFLTTYHSCPDHEGFAALEEEEWGMSRERLLLLFQIIKDADALDRVRFGPWGLDPAFLRLEQSHRLIAYAERLFYGNA